MMLGKAERAIAEQQAKETGRTAPWMVGEQLRDILHREPEAAEIVYQDLTAGGMSLREAEKKIKAFADKHKTGNFACVTPAEAEKIIREYFGLPEAGAQAAAQVTAQEKTEGKVIDLADFF